MNEKLIVCDILLLVTGMAFMFLGAYALVHDLKG